MGVGAAAGGAVEGAAAADLTLINWTLKISTEPPGISGRAAVP